MAVLANPHIMMAAQQPARQRIWIGRTCRRKVHWASHRLIAGNSRPWRKIRLHRPFIAADPRWRYDLSGFFLTQGGDIRTPTCTTLALSGRPKQSGKQPVNNRSVRDEQTARPSLVPGRGAIGGEGSWF